MCVYKHCYREKCAYLKYMDLLLCFYFLSIYFIASKKYFYLFWSCFIFLYFVIICDYKYINIVFDNICKLENIIPSGVINSIVSIMYNIILICTLNTFIELETFKLRVYFDICLITKLQRNIVVKRSEQYVRILHQISFCLPHSRMTYKSKEIENFGVQNPKVDPGLSSYLDIFDVKGTG